MLSLLPHYIINEELIKHLDNIKGVNNKEKALQHILEINANVIVFARNVVGLSGGKFCRIIFAPSLAEALRTNDFEDTASSQVALPTRPPSLGHVVQFLRSLSRNVIKIHDEINQIQIKLDDIQHITLQEIKEYLGPEDSAR